MSANSWQVDLSACTATHESGLIVRFTLAEDDAGGWQGEVVNIEKIDASNPSAVAGLVREAGDVYAQALRDRH